MLVKLIKLYLNIKEIDRSLGYGYEQEWQANRDLDIITEVQFYSEMAWVVMASGMKERVVRKKYPLVASAFNEFRVPPVPGEENIVEACKYFNNRRKISAICNNIDRIRREGFDSFINRVRKDTISVLLELDYIGPITCYHLAKNIGVQVAKPDRHLARIAAVCGFADVQELCAYISKMTGDSIPLVDIVLWRYATCYPGYIEDFRKIV